MKTEYNSSEAIIAFLAVIGVLAALVLVTLDVVSR